jgi:hypothetical protein
MDCRVSAARPGNDEAAVAEGHLPIVSHIRMLCAGTPKRRADQVFCGAQAGAFMLPHLDRIDCGT